MIDDASDLWNCPALCFLHLVRSTQAAGVCIWSEDNRGVTAVEAEVGLVRPVSLSWFAPAQICG